MKRLFLVSFLSLIVLSPAKADMSWQQAIEAVQAKSDRYYKKGHAMGETWLGTAYNEIGAKEHTCSILGRMLDKKQESEHLDVPTVAEPKTGRDYLMEGQSLSNWAVAAEYLVSLSKAQRIRTWNADCAGRMGIPASARIEDNGKTEFYDVRRNVLHVLGPVTKGYSNRLKAALDANPKVDTVALGSDGGNVIEALKAGQEIRRRGLETTLWNGCYSACPLVFLGGTRRVMWSPYEDLGFHKIYEGENSAIPLDDKLYALVYAYIKAMGADPEAVLAFMWSAEPKEMFVAKHDQLCASAVTTWIQRSCSAEDY
ncbi:hypothetical protein [Roseibium aggregatum]|jgi:hypothetical protein|uniref:Uncharacterized protein n=1 Tax=Roseibium aggregatum TaxID=187304 RepID=A0A0M6YBA3_9HYPH|nr:hypothetical protein [Roseibium aggregatum]CTQ47355.1 hypothetical protein LAL4801_05817 [Roseibium aggregatum]